MSEHWDSPSGCRAMLVVAAALLVSLLFVTVGTAQMSTPGSPVGNVTPSTEPASGVAVVARAAPVDGRVALLLHNGTTRPVRVDRITVTATSTDGGFAVKARGRTSYPQIVGADGLALTSVTFGEREVPDDATFSAKVRSTPASNAAAARALSVGDVALSAPGTGSVAQTVSATVTNGTTAWTARRPQIAVMCFGEAATPTTFTSAKVSARRIPPGTSASASVPLTTLCPTYLVAARAS